jgi:predicted sulfurtransferase
VAEPVRVAAFYRFAPFSAAELPALQQRLLAVGLESGMRGTVLLAEEGVNGTVSGPPQGVEALLAVYDVTRISQVMAGELTLAEARPMIDQDIADQVAAAQ